MNKNLFEEYCNKVHNEILDDKIKQLNRKVWLIKELNIIIKLCYKSNPYEISVIEDLKKKLGYYAKYIPNVLGTYEINNLCYVAIEYIHGLTLGEFLKTDPPPSNEQITNIALELKDFLITMRTYKQPYCTNLTQKDHNLKDDILRDIDIDEKATRSDPKTFKTLIENFIKKKIRSFFIDLTFESIPDPSHCVLTHGDLYVDNIIIRDSKLVAIIDWEQCGYYPSYWEGFKGSFKIGTYSKEEYLFFHTALYELDLTFYPLLNINRWLM